MDGAFPVIYGICLDAEAIWLGKAPENAQRPVLLSHQEQGGQRFTL